MIKNKRGEKRRENVRSEKDGQGRNKRFLRELRDSSRIGIMVWILFFAFLQPSTGRIGHIQEGLEKHSVN